MGGNLVANKKQTLINLDTDIELIKKHLGIVEINEDNIADIFVEDLIYDDAILNDMLSQDIDVGDVHIKEISQDG